MATEFDHARSDSRFRIVRRIGGGGMGVVYEAHDRERDQRVALKTLREMSATALYRFKQEFRSLAEIVHPNLVPLFELISDGEQWFFTMELVEGTDLLGYLQESSSEPAPPLTNELARGVSPGPNVAENVAARRTAATETDLARPHADPTDHISSERAVAAAPEFKAAGSAEAQTTDVIPPVYIEQSTERLPPELLLEPTTDLRAPFAAAPCEPTDQPPVESIRPRSDGGDDDKPVKTCAWSADPESDPEPSLDLSFHVNESPRTPVNVDPARLCEVFRQLVQGVSALHAAGKLHRDLKPSNVMVRPDGRVVLLDFGLVAELGADRAAAGDDTASPKQPTSRLSYRSTDSRISGTIAYMAPEQAAGGALTQASDWYAVGVMLFQALTGRLPYRGNAIEVLRAKQLRDAPAPVDLCDEIPAELNALCLDLMRRDPEARPAGDEVLRRLAGSTEPALAADIEPVGAFALPFVGRHEYLAQLDAAFAQVRAGRAVFYRVHGRSGAGKSALVQQFLTQIAQQQPAVVLAGRCYEQESVPYKAVDSMVDSLSRHLLRMRGSEAAALLPPDVAALARIFPVLHRVDAVAEAPKAAAEIPDVQQLRRRAFAALRELLGRIGAVRPLVLYIDDLQWGDVDSALLLAELLQGPDPPRLLLLACYRTEYVDSSECLRALESSLTRGGTALVQGELIVDPLRPDETHELTVRLLGADAADAPARADQIVRESRGSPLFVYELVRHVKAGLELAETGGLDLDDVLWKRVQRLPDDPRRLLELVAVAGQPVRLRTVQEASRLRSLPPQVMSLLRAGHLLRGTGPSLDDDVETFHDRIRESVVARLPATTLKAHHGNLAVSLEASGKADPEAIAVHFHAADEPARAGHYFALAADQAAGALAFDRAATLYRRSIELRPLVGADGRRLRTRLADALANAGRGPDAAREYQAAAQDASGTEWLDLERRAAFHFSASGHTEQGKEGFRTVLAHIGMKIPASPGRSVASLLWQRFKLWCRGVEFTERPAADIPESELERIDITWSASLGFSMLNMLVAADFLTRNVLMSLRAGEPFRVARALAWEAAHYGNNGVSAWPRTQQLLEIARRQAEKIAEPYATGMVLMAHGITQFTCGRFVQSREILEQAQAHFRDRCTGVTWEYGTTATFNMWNLTYMGDWAEKTRRTAALLKESVDHGDLYTATNLATYSQPLILLAADRPDEAMQSIDEYMSRWEQHDFHVQHMTSMLGRGYVAMYRGEHRQACDRLLSDWRRLVDAQFHRVQIIRVVAGELCTRSLLAAAAHADNPTPLLRRANRWIRSLKREPVPYAAALARLLGAGASWLRGERDATVHQLRSAISALDGVDMRMFAAAARRRLGELLGGDEGRQLTADGDDWMTRHGVRNRAALTHTFTPWVDY